MDKPAITMQPVKSTSLRAFGYDAATQTLAVEFKNGKRYDYPNINQEQADGLANAKSVGSYMNQLIRGAAAKGEPGKVREPHTRAPVRRRAGR